MDIYIFHRCLLTVTRAMTKSLKIIGKEILYDEKDLPKKIRKRRATHTPGKSTSKPTLHAKPKSLPQAIAVAHPRKSMNF